MVRYKEMYNDILEKYRKLSAHSIDLRTADVLIFNKDKWDMKESKDQKAYVMILKPKEV